MTAAVQSAEYAGCLNKPRKNRSLYLIYRLENKKIKCNLFKIKGVIS